MSDRLDWDEIMSEAGSREWGSLEELNAWLARKTRTYNQAPQEQLSGLSPEQAARLFADDWGGGGPLQMNESLTLSDLRDVRFLLNARVVLSTLESEGPVKATAATKSFPRKFVGSVIDRMAWEDGLLEKVKEFNKVIDELDAFPLHLQRIILKMSGLIKLRSGKFSITQKGKAYLPEERAGELYAVLFRTYFRSFNLAYLDHNEQNAAMQHTMAMTLYRLGRAPRSWKSPETWANEILMEDALDQPPNHRGENSTYDQFRTRILRPLEAFGLVEKCELEGPNQFLPQYEYRVGDLFDRFIRFDFA